MLVPDILEPMDLTRILKQPKSDGVHRRITPALVKEPTSPVQMLEIRLIRFRAPEIHVGDFEVGPKVAGRIAVRYALVIRPPVTIAEEIVRVFLVQVLAVRCHKLHRLGPERLDALRRVVEGDGEAVRFVVVAHVAENVVVDIAEEVHVGLYTPVVLVFQQGGMFVEEAAVPSAHLVVGLHMCVLHVLVFEVVCALLHQVSVDPAGNGPVFFRDGVVGALCFCLRLGYFFEFFGEGFVVDEGPGVVEFVVPCSL